jgi:hypothetical protein
MRERLSQKTKMGYEPNMITAPLALVIGKRKHKIVNADFYTQA